MCNKTHWEATTFNSLLPRQPRQQEKQMGTNTNSSQHYPALCESLISSQWASTVCSQGDYYHPMPHQEEPLTFECGANTPETAGQDPERLMSGPSHDSSLFFFNTVGFRFRGLVIISLKKHHHIQHGWLIVPSCFFLSDCSLFIALCLPITFISWILSAQTFWQNVLLIQFPKVLIKTVN